MLQYTLSPSNLLYNQILSAKKKENSQFNRSKYETMKAIKDITYTKKRRSIHMFNLKYSKKKKKVFSPKRKIHRNRIYLHDYMLFIADLGTQIKNKRYVMITRMNIIL